MNQINPLHIAALLLTVILFLFYKLSIENEELVTAKQEYAQTKKVATQLQGLQSVYGDKKKLEAALQRVLRQPSLKDVEFTRVPSKDGMKIAVDTISANELNTLMGKLLNGNYNISTLNIRKKDENQASLEMEIKW